MFSACCDKTSQFRQIYSCNRCFTQVLAETDRRLVSLIFSAVLCQIKQLNFNQRHSYARYLAQASPAIVHRYFMLVFEKETSCVRCFQKFQLKQFDFLSNLFFVNVFNRTNTFQANSKFRTLFYTSFYIPKTGHPCFLNVFDKTSLFLKIQFQAQNHSSAGCFAQV